MLLESFTSTNLNKVGSNLDRLIQFVYNTVKEKGYGIYEISKEDKEHWVILSNMLKLQEDLDIKIHYWSGDFVKGTSVEFSPYAQIYKEWFEKLNV